MSIRAISGDFRGFLCGGIVLRIFHKNGSMGFTEDFWGIAVFGFMVKFAELIFK